MSQPFQPRLQPEASVSFLSSEVQSYRPHVQSQNALKVACPDQASGKIPEDDLPLNYSQHPSVAPVKSTFGSFYTITGIALKDEGGDSCLERYHFIVQKGTIDSIPLPESVDTHNSGNGPRESSSCAFRLDTTFESRYQVLPNNLPPSESCPTSCRGLFERGMQSVHSKQPQAPLTAQSSSSSIPRTSQISSHGVEFCKPFDESIIFVSCRVPRFTELCTDRGTVRVPEYVIVEFNLENGKWNEVNSHFKTIPVHFNNNHPPFEFAHKSYTFLSLQDSFLSHSLDKGSTDNVPSEPDSLSCESIDKDEATHDYYHDTDITPLSSPSRSLSNKRPRTNEQLLQQNQQEQHKNKGSKTTTTAFARRRRVSFNNETLSPCPQAAASKVLPPYSAQGPSQVPSGHSSQTPTQKPNSHLARISKQDIPPSAAGYHHQHELVCSMAACQSQGAPPYKMRPDRGALTVREAWDEFHGPLQNLRCRGQLPKNSSIKRAYSRRAEFVSMIIEAAKVEGCSPEDLVDEWTETFRGRTINSIREDLKAGRTKKMVKHRDDPH